MAIQTIIQNYMGVKCKCKHCGYEWYARTVVKPRCCAAQCTRQWYWDEDPDKIPAYQPRPRKSKRKRAA